MNEIQEVLYFSKEFPTRALLEEQVETQWDATTASNMARCPRYGEYKIRYGLTRLEEAPYLKAGNALHSALSLLYSGVDPDLCLAEIARVWGKGRDEFLPPTHRFQHLHLGFLETVFKNYLTYSKRDTFKTITCSMDDLDLSTVLGAVFRVAPDGKVILGESKIVMRFLVEGQPFVYSGKPDLPIEMGGSIYVMDHKSTNSYLSDWYFDQYRFSNQLRGYCAMVQQLLPQLHVNGAMINGLYMGEKAVATEFKGNRFGRFGPMLFQPSHLAEAIRNQYEWRQTLDYHESRGYYPQHTSKLCVSCEYDGLCAADVRSREGVMRNQFTQITRRFLDL